MAKKSKDARVQVILESIEQNENRKSPVSRDIGTQNKESAPDRIARKSYHPGVGRVTVHKEIK